jgi:hypothetical protein
MKAVQLEAERVRQQVMAELQALRQQTLEEAEQVRQKAYEEAQLVRESADEYAETVLKTLSRNLDEFQNVSKNAQKQLKRTRAEAMQAQHPQAAIRSANVPAKAKESRHSRSERLPETKELGV